MNEKKLYVLQDDDGETETLLLTDDQAAMFYYLKEKDYICDYVELAPIDCQSPTSISYEDYHYERI